MNLFSKSVTNLRWATLDYATRQLMQLITTLILARYLHPSDFGLISMIIVIVGFVAIFKDLGTAAAVIQAPTISNEMLSTIFWINLVFGLVLTISLMLSASQVAKFYNNSAVTPLLQMISVTFVISSLTVLHQALLQRSLFFERLAKISIVSTFVGSIFGIGCAINGTGAMSLVYQSISLTLVSTILLWISVEWRPQFVLKWNELGTIRNFSMNLIGFSIFNYFSRNADYLIVGRFLGAEALGHYTLAYQIMLYPVQFVSSIISRVMFPAYAQIQNDDQRLGRSYLRMVNSISWIVFPAMVGIGAVSTPFIYSVFGKEWLPASMILLVLAPVGLTQSVATTVSTIYQAKGRTDWMFRWSVVASIIRIVAFVIGLRWGALGVAIAYALTTFALLYHNFSIPFSLINLKTSTLFNALREPTLYTFIMLLVIVVWQFTLSEIKINSPIIVLASSVIVGGCTYIGLLVWQKPASFLDALQILPFPLPSRLIR